LIESERTPPLTKLVAMQTLMSLSWLFVAALLEASGDAIVRLGLHTSPALRRVLLLAAGGLILFAYGCVVNVPAWGFGRLLGVYVVFFFLIAQAIDWIVFGQPPARAIWLGGMFIVTGGAIMAFG
jgi:drug/metabolite transporter superfamily protein YnfA